MTPSESMQHLTEIRAELARLAGDGRKAQVQTFGGWRDADEWTPYGIGKPESIDRLTVRFEYDADRAALREQPASDSLAHLVPSDVFIWGLWPVQFVASGAQPAPKGE